MTNRAHDRVADALRAEWQDEHLSDEARQRVASRMAQVRRRRRRRLVVAPAIALALATVAVLVVSTRVEDGPRAAEVRERAGVAVDPGDDVLHYVATIRQDHSAGGSGSPDVEMKTEVWDYPAGRRSRTLVWEDGRLSTEIASVDGEVEFWSAADGGKPRQLAPPAGSKRNRSQAYPPFAAGNLDQIRAALPNSRIHGPLADEATGREVYEIQTTTERAPDALTTRRLEYRVDARTFAPVRLVSTVVGAAPELVSPRPGDTVTTEFTLVERLSPERAAPGLRPTWSNQGR